ncbi:MAG: glycosyltransferase family 2 protein, partial [Rikenellaceae bacterium]
LSVEIIFWIFIFIVFYTYIGYGMLLYFLVKIKELVKGKHMLSLPNDLPEVTLLIAAYNEQDIIAAKMNNTLSLDYPPTRLKIVWVTDGSNDKTCELLSAYKDVEVLFEPTRMGKSAALNRAMNFIHTPIVVFTDANTMICSEAIKEIVTQFTDPKVGCVAGEKRVAQLSMQDATAGEGIYWKYESTLKDLDYRLYSAVGAAGELFAIRTSLFVQLPNDTLLDDFVMSMKIAQKGYKISYCSRAYALENASADISEESKRKIRISAGGIQSVVRLYPLLNIFRYGILSFQYISHRVLRWSITPLLVFLLLPLNIYLAIKLGFTSLYGVVLLFQGLFYLLGICGYILNRRKIKNKLMFIPYYFLFMNLSVLRGVLYLQSHKGSGVWEKAQRKNG